MSTYVFILRLDVAIDGEGVTKEAVAKVVNNAVQHSTACEAVADALAFKWPDVRVGLALATLGELPR